MSERQHAIFETALRRIRCPKCAGKVLETMMPDAVCEKCGTQYVLATRVNRGFFNNGLSAQLIEKNQPSQVAPSVATSLSQAQTASATPIVGGRFCHNCGSPAKDDARFCTSCATQLS